MFDLFKKNDSQRSTDRWVFGIMLAAGILALIASFVLTLDKFEVLADPDATLSCSINLVLDCSRVMQTPQSSLFGFPNMIIGLMAYSVVITIAVAGLMGVRFPNAFLVAATVGFLAGLLFSYWLFFQSVYVIQILCPWCLVVTFATTLIVSATTYYTLRQNAFGLSKRTNEKVQSFLNKGYLQLATASWIVLLVGLVILQFGADLFA